MLLRLVGQPYWRLRDDLQGSAVRKRRIQAQSRAATAVAEVAGAQPTYGYRRGYPRLCQQGSLIGRERVRQWMGVLGLRLPVPLKKKRPIHPVVAECHWPKGRRLQIDAIRFHLDDGVAWVYWVKDVKTRPCVVARAAATLSQKRAAATWRVKPGTGAILAYSGCPSGLREIAATNGTVFSEPRPALPPVSSPLSASALSRSAIAGISLC